MELTAEQIKLVQIIEKFYSKTIPASSEPLLYTTKTIFEKAQSVYPSEKYTTDDIYAVMCYLKFEFVDSTGSKLLWLLRVQE